MGKFKHHDCLYQHLISVAILLGRRNQEAAAKKNHGMSAGDVCIPSQAICESYCMHLSRIHLWRPL